MKITKARLEEIILEEIINIENEELLSESIYMLIDLQAKQMGVTLTEQEKESLAKRLRRAARRNAFGLGVGAATALAGKVIVIVPELVSTKYPLPATIVVLVVTTDCQLINLSFLVDEAPKVIPNAVVFASLSLDTPPSAILSLVTAPGATSTVATAPSSIPLVPTLFIGILLFIHLYRLLDYTLLRL